MRVSSYLLLSLGVSLAIPFAAPAMAQEYPAQGKTLTINVPWNAGGGVDAAVRLLQPGLEQSLGIPVQVVNQPGGGSQAGLSRCMSERPDGYTLCASSLPSTNLTYVVPDRGAPYTRDSFKSVATVAFEFGSVVVGKDSPYKSIEDLVTDARARPGQVRAGNAGRFTNAHIDMLAFERATETQLAPVFFSGGAPAITALMGGHVDIVTSTPSNYMGQVQSGDVRVLGIMSSEESPLLPCVPTIAEEGYEVSGFTTRTFAFQPDVPDEIAAKMEAAILEAAASDQFKEGMARLGAEVRLMGATETSELWDKVDADIVDLLATQKE